VHSDATVIVPFDDGVVFIRSFNRAECSRRLTEVAQSLDTISGSKLLAAGHGLGQRWLPGSIGVRSGAAVYERRLGSVTQLSNRATGYIGHISSCLFSEWLQAW